MTIADVIEKIQDWIVGYGMKIIIALLIFVIGRIVAKVIKNLVVKMMEKSKVDAEVISFIGNLTYIALMVFIVLAALNQLGIQTASFIAIIGAAGLAIGLAFQGALSNFAAGFLLIVFRPFRVGDFIEGAGVSGTVMEIQIFTTQLTTLDNRKVIVPNAKLAGDNIINYTAMEARRVVLTVGVSYSEDLKKVKTVLMDILTSDERILDDPAPMVGVGELANSSVNFVVRPYVKPTDYWDVYFDIPEAIKIRFDKEGIKIPFPQRDVHIYNKDK